MTSLEGCRRFSSTATDLAATPETSSTSGTPCNSRVQLPAAPNERQFQFVNNWTKLQGNHTIKFGADIRHAMNLRIPSDRHRAGELQFNAARTQGPAAAARRSRRFFWVT